MLVIVWIDRVVSEGERDRLEHVFRVAASNRADALIDRLQHPLADLTTLQRLIRAEPPDGTAFRKLVEPLLGQPGVLGYRWVSRVAATDRAAFEQTLEPRHGARAITERDTDGQRRVAPRRTVYFSQRFGVPAERNGNDAGLDFYADPALKALIDQAIESGEAVAGESGTLRLEGERADAMLIVAPVFRGDRKSVV